MSVRVTYYEDALTRAGERVVDVDAVAVGAALRLAGVDLPFERLAVAVNGAVVEDANALLAFGDEILVVPRPREASTAILIAITIASALASAALQSRIKAPRPSSTEQGERAYGFTRFSSDAYPGEPLRVMLGKRWTGGKVVAKVPGEGVDGSGDSRLKILIDLSAGPVKSIAGFTTDTDAAAATTLADVVRLNNQPIANFPGASVSVRLGSASQTALPGFADTEVLREVGVGGAALPNTSGADRTGTDASGEAFTFTTLDPVHAVVPRVRFPAGLYRLGGSGQIDVRRVQWRVRWRAAAGPGAWSAWRVITVEQARQTEFFSAPRVEIAAPGDAAVRVDVQVERVSAAAAGGDATIVDSMVWDSATEITRSNNRYPGRALLALDLVAGEQLQGVPQVSVLIEGFAACKVWDGTSPIDTPTFVDQYSENPVYQAVTAMTNAVWGLGGTYGYLLSDSAFLASAAAAGQYADALVDRPVAAPDGTTQRRRFRGHFVLDEAKPGIEWIRTILAAARCQIVPQGRSWRIVCDRPRNAVETFGDKTIRVDGEGRAMLSIRREFATGGISRPNRITAQIENQFRSYQAEPISYPAVGALWLGTEPEKTEDVRFDGVTDPDQAAAELVVQMQKIRSITRTVKFTTTKAAVVTQPGDRFDLASSLPGWGLASGAVLAGCTTTAIKLDRSVTLAAATTYVLRVIFDDGAVEDRVVSSPAGTYAAGTSISVSAAFSAAPHQFAEYALGVQTVAVKPFVCTALRCGDTRDLPWEIEGVEYSADVYTDNGGEVVLPDYSTLRTGLTPPGPLLSIVAAQREDNGRLFVDLGWTQAVEDAEITAAFRVYRRRVGTSSWVLVPQPTITTRSAIVELTERDAGYEFVAVAVSIGGAALSPNDPRHPIASMVLGLASPPPDAPGTITVTNTGGNTYTLSWTAVAGAVGYQVLVGGNTGTGLPNDGAEDCLVLRRVVAPEITGLELAPGVSVTFWIRSVSSAGRLSWTAAVATIASPAVPGGESIRTTRTFDLQTEGTLSNITRQTSPVARIIQTSAGTAGVWTSPEVDLGSSSLTELTYRIGSDNAADDPLINTDPFQIPSIEADQWGVVSGSPAVVGMLMPPWPDDRQRVLVEVRTSDAGSGGAWGAWEPLGLAASVRRMIRRYQVRLTLTRTKAPYRPGVRSMVVVTTA